MESADTGVIELSLPSKMGYEKVAMTTAASVAKLMGFSDERIDDLKTAVAEACINSIEHGNRLNESLTVEIILVMRNDSLEIKVCDQGTGVSKNVSIPDIDLKMEGSESPRGMGMFLIQGLVDEVEWTSSPEEGGCARLVIHLNKPASKE